MQTSNVFRIKKQCSLNGVKHVSKDLTCSSNGKESTCNEGDQGLIPELGRSSGEGNDNPLQYSCLDNPTDRGAWWATDRDVTKYIKP